MGFVPEEAPWEQLDYRSLFEQRGPPGGIVGGVCAIGPVVPGAAGTGAVAAAAGAAAACVGSRGFSRACNVLAPFYGPSRARIKDLG